MRSDNETGRTPRSRVQLGLAIVIVLALAGVGAAFVLRRSPSGEARVFRYAFAAGEERLYEMDMKVRITPDEGQGAPFEASVRGMMTLSVVDRRSDGATVLDLSLDELETAAGEAPAVPAEGGDMRLTVARDGRIVDAAGRGGLFSAAGLGAAGTGGAVEGMGAQLLFPHYPDDPLAPGDGWSRTSTIPLPFGSQQARVASEGRLEGYEQSPSGHAARFDLTVTSPIDYTVTAAELARASGATGYEPPEGAELTVDGRTVTEADALVVPSTGELLELEGTTTMSARMTAGDSAAEAQGSQNGYAFETTITMSLVREG